jgi:hypothetical protein
MTAKYKTVDEYLKELSKSKDEKPPQVKQGLEIFLDMWETVLQKGIVKRDDDIESALAKLDRLGGLYRAAEESDLER